MLTKWGCDSICVGCITGATVELGICVFSDAVIEDHTTPSPYLKMTQHINTDRLTHATLSMKTMPAMTNKVIGDLFFKANISVNKGFTWQYCHCPQRVHSFWIQKWKGRCHIYAVICSANFIRSNVTIQSDAGFCLLRIFRLGCVKYIFGGLISSLNWGPFKVCKLMSAKVKDLHALSRWHRQWVMRRLLEVGQCIRAQVHLWNGDEPIWLKFVLWPLNQLDPTWHVSHFFSAGVCVCGQVWL